MTPTNSCTRPNEIVEPMYQKLAMHLALCIARQWGLDRESTRRLFQLEGHQKLVAWETNQAHNLTLEAYMHLSTIITINKILREAVGTPPNIRKWLRWPLANLADRSPLELLLSGKTEALQRIAMELHITSFALGTSRDTGRLPTIH